MSVPRASPHSCGPHHTSGAPLSSNDSEDKAGRQNAASKPQIIGNFFGGLWLSVLYAPPALCDDHGGHKLSEHTTQVGRGPLRTQGLATSGRDRKHLPLHCLCTRINQALARGLSRIPYEPSPHQPSFVGLCASTSAATFRAKTLQVPAAEQRTSVRVYSSRSRPCANMWGILARIRSLRQALGPEPHSHSDSRRTAGLPWSFPGLFSRSFAFLERASKHMRASKNRGTLLGVPFIRRNILFRGIFRVTP